MSPERPRETLCSEVELKLSAFIDGELPELERLGIERHLGDCSGCRRELDLLGQASTFLRREGGKVSEPPAWASVRSRLETLRPRSAWRDRVGLEWAVAVSIGLIALAGLLVALALGEWPRGGDGLDGLVEAPRLQLAGLPGLETFLAEHRAQEIDSTELAQRLNFTPDLPEELPGGFRLARTYLVRDSCCAGSCLIYRRGDELVSLVQHPPSHPVSWSSGTLESCTIAGRLCRRGRGREIEILQIEPEGRNLTIVTRTGTLDPVALVRALAAD